MDSRVARALEVEAAKKTADTLEAILPRLAQIEKDQTEVLALLKRHLPGLVTNANSKGGSK